MICPDKLPKCKVVCVEIEGFVNCIKSDFLAACGCNNSISCFAPVAGSMEYFNQNFGLIYYETVISGKYDISPLNIKGVHDFGYVYFDDKYKKRISRLEYTSESKGLKALFSKKNSGKFLMSAINGNRKIGVLVDAMGRVNYGEHMTDRKGITDIYIGNQRQMGYDVYTIPLDNLDKLEYKADKKEVPLFLKGSFKAESNKDCFVHLNGFKKGYVWVNGFSDSLFLMV